MNNDTSFDINTNSNPVQTVAQPKEDNEMLRATDKITALYLSLIHICSFTCGYSLLTEKSGYFSAFPLRS